MLKLIEENAMLRNEMELAKRIQTFLLPKKPLLTGYDIKASLVPAEDVGGDYYDIITIEGYNWLVVGDVTGHGLTAGLVMMMVQTSIHSILIQNPSISPSQLLSVINKTIFDNIKKMGESKHMTIIVFAVLKKGKFLFSGLHEDILIRRSRSGLVDEIETNGMWIGLEPDISDLLITEKLELESGDCMVLYTDGITEALGKDGEFYGDDYLKEVISQNGYKSALDIHTCIINSLEPYQILDDVTVVVLKRD